MSESNEEPVVEMSESNEEPVVEMSESNEEPVMEKWIESNDESFEEKCIPQVMSSSEHFKKEILEKDSCDPTFGDGFEIDRIMNPKFIKEEDIFLFEVQWRHGNFAGTDLLRSSIIYGHWPDVALEFYYDRYNIKKEDLKDNNLSDIIDNLFK